jgi:hypothetical protein
MIINVRGTSGSGKSTVVARAMEMFETKHGVNIKGRRQPIGYYLGNNYPPELAQLAVPGHYETACGGCDTLPGYDKIFQYVREGAKTAKHVLFEGVLVSEEVNRTIQLHQAFPGQLLVIQLTTPTDVCLSSIQARRDARGDARPLNPKNTVARVATIQRSCERLKAAGVAVEEHDRNSAANRVMEIINGHS